MSFTIVMHASHLVPPFAHYSLDWSILKHNAFLSAIWCHVPNFKSWIIKTKNWFIIIWWWPKKKCQDFMSFTIKMHVSHLVPPFDYYSLDWSILKHIAFLSAIWCHIPNFKSWIIKTKNWFIIIWWWPKKKCQDFMSFTIKMHVSHLVPPFDYYSLD